MTMERVVSKHVFNYQLDGLLDPETEALDKVMKKEMPFEMGELPDKPMQELIAIARKVMDLMDLESHPSLVKATKDCIHTKFEVPPRDGNDYAVPVLVHTPKPLEGKTDKAAMIYAHGGGCVSGSAAKMQSFLSKSAVLYDIVIFNVDYRLAPETKCPKNALDFYCVVKHIAENADAFGVDASRICINGDSGGAYVVAATSVMLAQKDESNLIKLAMLGVPMLDDYEFGDIASMTKEERGHVPLMKRIWEAVATDLEAQRRNGDPLLFPAKASDETLAKFPPTIICEMEFDIFITQACRFASRLRAAGRLLELYVLPGAAHISTTLPGLKICEKMLNDYKMLLDTYLK